MPDNQLFNAWWSAGNTAFISINLFKTASLIKNDDFSQPLY